MNFWESFGTGVLGSVVASVIISVFAVRFLKRSLHDRINELINADQSARRIKESIAGALSFLDRAQINIHTQLVDPNINKAVPNWFNSEINEIRMSINTAASEVDSLRGSLDTIARAGRKLQ